MRSPACAFLVLLAAAAGAETLDLSRSVLECQGDVRFVRDATGIALTVDDPRGQLRLTPASGGTWDLSAAETVAVDLENLSPTRQLRLNLRVKADRELVVGAALNPAEKRTLTFRLPHRWQLAAPPGVPGPATLDTTRIESIDVFMQWPFEAPAAGLVSCRIGGLRAEGRLAPRTPRREGDAFFPFVDPFGQFIHADWPEKIRAPEDLLRARAAEEAELAAAKRPEEWDVYGGWRNGPQLQATGSFRTEKHQGKWWLVDPEGRLFFSHGMCVLRDHTDAMRTTGRRTWFAGTPSEPNWQPVEGNLVAKYGTPDYAQPFFETLARRLESWGFNSIGDWGDNRLMLLGRTPYTLQLTDYNDKLPRMGKKFYDVFDPAYAEHMRTVFTAEGRNRELLAKSIDDPFCIGYFIDNELKYIGRIRLAAEVLKCPAKQPAKIELVRWLKERHGSIATLNGRWGTTFPEWNGILAATEAPESEGWRTDAQDFSDLMLERYFRICRDTVKAAAPHRLYLGSRFVGTDAVRPELYQACAKYSDVLSVNIYAHTPANFPVAGFPDIPVLIGEFHFGIADRGLFSPGLCIAGATKADRALAYTRFMQGALAHPLIVGAHWFQFRDQPLLGRWDGEGYQIGFVDVADTPYREMTAAARRIGDAMYRYRSDGRLTDLPDAAAPPPR